VQSVLLVEVREKLQDNNALVSASNSISAKLNGALKFEWFHELGAELKGFMQRIITINIATYNAVIALQGSLASSLEGSLIQEPFILGDAIGRISTVHMQFITSWEAFDAVLDRRFQGVLGHTKVKNREYTLQEHATRREITRSRPWEATFLPGQRIDMSLVFSSEEKETTGTSCPSCQTASEGSQDAKVLWYSIKLLLLTVCLTNFTAKVVGSGIEGSQNSSMPSHLPLSLDQFRVLTRLRSHSASHPSAIYLMGQSAPVALRLCIRPRNGNWITQNSPKTTFHSSNESVSFPKRTASNIQLVLFLIRMLASSLPWIPLRPKRKRSGKFGKSSMF
jgi:hypothetical protein